MLRIVVSFWVLVGCQQSEPEQPAARTTTFTGRAELGTENPFYADKLPRTVEQIRRDEHVEAPDWYLTGSEEVFRPVIEAEALGRSQGIPLAGLSLRVRFEGRPTGEQFPGYPRELEVVRFDEVTLCPRKPQSLHGCSN